MTASNLDDLIRRVEAATGPDRELDFDVCAALGLYEAEPTYGPHLRRIWHGPRLTASIDAALALVEKVLPGCTDTSDASYPEAGIEWTLFPDGGDDWITGTAKTRPLAIIAALLRALKQQEDRR